MTNPLETLAYAYDKPNTTAVLKRFPIDFRVDEVLGFEPSGEGEHVFLRIKKTGFNTEDVAKRLAECAGVRRMAVSFAGMKDKQGITSQWFSVHLPGKIDIDWTPIESDDIEILSVMRHDKKLKRGALRGNRFQITLRDCEGEQAEFISRLEQLSKGGMPNYFGEQRFGIEGRNLLRAKQFFMGEIKKLTKTKRSLYLSAARSAIFNDILSARIKAGTWSQALAGDVMMLDGSHSVFTIDAVDALLTERLEQGDIHPTGALYGKTTPTHELAAQDLEAAVFAQHPIFTAGLEKQGMKMDRRALRVLPSDLSYAFTASKVLELSFYLPKGAYATSLLRELTQCELSR